MVAEHAAGSKSSSSAMSAHDPRRRALTIAALGVVFGDIGTSPLYAFRQCFTSSQGIPLNQGNVLGILSLIVWSLIVVISVKYVTVMLRAGNRGEGGVLALSTLVGDVTRNWRFWGPVGTLGMLGAALFLGDGVLTPAISVLSAVEGLSVVTPRLQSLVLPLTVGILLALFAVQRTGTEKVGRVFGPIIIIWFLALGVLGAIHIIRVPSVLAALNPIHAIAFFSTNGSAAFFVLSAVFLCVTGGEALYADMGHFGRVPIRDAWFVLVLPALTLNYFGQGALVLQDPEAIKNPFYLLAPSWLLVPLIALATAATIIASQAVISGVFSVATQAMNLGYLPRMRVLQSSASAIGQVYVPTANWTVFVGTVLLVVGFQTSDALAGAYGIAVSATMCLAGLLLFVAPRVLDEFPHRLLFPVLVVISSIDLVFLASNVVRVFENGWVSFAMAAVMFAIMSTWNAGRRLLNWTVTRRQTALDELIKIANEELKSRAPGTAVYLTNESSTVPLTLVQQLRFHRFLHERVIILTFVRVEIPRVANDERIQSEMIAKGVFRISARYGFMERPNTVNALRAAEYQGIHYDLDTTYYVVGRTTPVVTRLSGLSLWRKRLFLLMARNARVGYEYFGVPTHRLLEIGNQVEI